MNLKLTTRIFLGYLIPMIAVFAAGALVYQKSLVVQTTLVQVEQAARLVDLGTKLELHGSRVQSVTRGLLLSGEQTNFRDYDEATANVKVVIDQLDVLVKDPAQRATLAAIRGSAEKIETATQAQIDLLKQGRQAEAQNLFKSMGSAQYYEQFTVQHQAFFKRESEIQKERSTQVQQAANDMTTTAWQAVIVVLLLSLVAATLLSRQIGSRLRALSGAIATSTQEIVATTAEHERAMEEQASSVAETSATVEEVINSAKANSEQAQLATDSARQASETAVTGLDLSDRNRDEMAKLEAAMLQFAEQIGALSEQAGQIGEISRVVSDLAAQTNMLALNAAVEASRAGEQGKGFAVVASEIRKLADQSKKSAASSTEIVTDIQKATERMVNTAEQSTSVTRSVATSVQEVVAALEHVKALSETVHMSSQQVQFNSSQQASALSQVGGAVASINDGARAMSAGTVQIRTGMERLADATAEMNRLI